MNQNFFQKGYKTVNKNNIFEALQQAIEIEIATIPTYLFTYYSIVRVPDQPSIKDQIYRLLMTAGLAPDEANQKAQEFSADIMVLANKAGASIMSVAVEEMLHMSLSSNVKQALGELPQLICRSPFNWPAQLAGHEPPFDINKAKLSLEQLKTFMKIESPQPLKGTAKKSENAFEYMTIGQFYQEIEDCIKKDFANKKCYDPARPQLVPNKGYYAQNCIDTTYYSKQHQAKFMNAKDSGNLIHVVDKDSALKALETVVEQGEGCQKQGFDENGNVVCGVIKPSFYDDRDHKELDHFAKFNELYCHLELTQQRLNHELGNDHFDIGSLFIHDFQVNPTTADYPEKLQSMSALLNAIYSYIFVMSEACYKADEHTQYEIFMFGIHKSMMWILDSLCGTINGYTYNGPDGEVYTAAPTFEEYPFSSASSPKSQIIALFEDALADFPDLSYLKTRIDDLPDVCANGDIPQPVAMLLAD